MVIYDSNNVTRLYLSPYIKPAWDDRGVTLYQTVFHTSVRIEAEKAWLTGFLDLLKKGTDPAAFSAKVREAFPKADPNRLLTECIGNGVIE